MVDKHARIHRHTQTGRQTHTHTHTHISEKIRHQTYTQIYSYTQRNSIFCCESENLITPSVLSSVCLLFHLLIAGVSLYRSIALSICRHSCCKKLDCMCTFLVLWGFFILEDFFMSTSVVFTHPGCGSENTQHSKTLWATLTLYLTSCFTSQSIYSIAIIEWPVLLVLWFN